jgi:hypothetical protein
MATRWLDSSTLSVTELRWNGAIFEEPAAQQMWEELPPGLGMIAVTELAAGNHARNILRHMRRGIVLLAFSGRPLAATPARPDLRVHTAHAHGNYCYGGTFCTFEDVNSGCFLAFDDPSYFDTV